MANSFTRKLGPPEQQKAPKKTFEIVIKWSVWKPALLDQLLPVAAADLERWRRLLGSKPY
jgi:hypothetical protein